MGAFKQTYKKVYETSISGATTELTVDNIFRPHNHYLIIGDSFYNQTTGSSYTFYLRHDGANDTGGSYQRGNNLAQHGGSSLTVQADNTSRNGGAFMYVGNSAVESGAFKLFMNTTRAYSQTDSYWFDAIGHLDGTGYRGNTVFSTKLSINRYDGFQIDFGGQSAIAGNLKIYEVDVAQSEYLTNV